MNKNQNLWLILGTGLSLAVSGCSKDGAKPTTVATQKDENPKIAATNEGKYQSACDKLGDWGSHRTTIEISSTQITSQTSMYATADCTEMAYITVKQTGIVERIGEIHGEGRELDTRITGVTYTPGNERGVEIANESELCGLFAWELNVERDVSGLICNEEKMPDVGTLDYDIIRFQNDELQLGQGDSTQADARTTKLDPQVFKKVL